MGGGEREADDCGAQEPKNMGNGPQKSDTRMGHSTEHKISDSAITKGT